ncbi:MAG TPA: hypothetical protein VJS44_08310 [Pyrinomonadaceae bacterium]|nr:hypothetical protein [Pyrinomonadaceae bacterium]
MIEYPQFKRPLPPQYTVTPDDEDYPVFSPPPNFGATVTVDDPGTPPDLPVGPTRPRLATGVRGESNPQSPYERAAARLRDLENEPVVDENGRLASAGIMAGQPIQPTNSLGYAFGARAGNALSGWLNPESDETLKREAEKAKQRQVVQTEAALEKEARDRREQEAEIANKEDLPVFRREDLARKEESDRQRNETTGRRLDELERANKEREKDRDEDRTSRESEGEKNRQSRERIATEARELKKEELEIRREQNAERKAERARELKLKQDAFGAKYPGFGKPPIYKSEVDRLQAQEDAAALKSGRTPRNIRKDAVDKGWEIDDNK